MNPYWDAVKTWASRNPVGQMVLGWRYAAEGLDLPHADEVPEHMFIDARLTREDLVRRYAWTITAPDTVQFVHEHVGSVVVDPLAGNGYWAYLLTRASGTRMVAASDTNQPVETWCPVAVADAAQAVRNFDGWPTLLLAWPPSADPTGADVLEAYTGNRVVFLGELDGSCGGDRMRDLLRTEWSPVAKHQPAQWNSYHDVVVVYERHLAGGQP